MSTWWHPLLSGGARNRSVDSTTLVVVGSKAPVDPTLVNCHDQPGAWLPLSRVHRPWQRKGTPRITPQEKRSQ